MTAAPAFFAAMAMGEAPGTPSAIIDMCAIYGGLVLGNGGTLLSTRATCLVEFLAAQH